MAYSSDFAIIIPDKTTTNGTSWHKMDARLVLETRIVLLEVFTAQCTLVQSAVLQSHVVPSVCLSVCNVGGL